MPKFPQFIKIIRRKIFLPVIDKKIENYFTCKTIFANNLDFFGCIDKAKAHVE